MKKLVMTVDVCTDCPYCTYDSFYSRSQDSGYDCSKVNKRLVDDWEKKTTIEIPSWCPLEESSKEGCLGIAPKLSLSSDGV